MTWLPTLALIGDVLGGFGTAIGVALAVYAAWAWLPQQLEAFAKTQRSQRQEEVAGAFFVAAKRYGDGASLAARKAAAKADRRLAPSPMEADLPEPDLEGLRGSAEEAWQLAQLHGIEEELGRNLFLNLFGFHGRSFGLQRDFDHILLAGDAPPERIKELHGQVVALHERIDKELRLIEGDLRAYIRYESSQRRRKRKRAK